MTYEHYCYRIVLLRVNRSGYTMVGEITSEEVKVESLSELQRSALEWHLDAMVSSMPADGHLRRLGATDTQPKDAMRNNLLGAKGMVQDSVAPLLNKHVIAGGVV